MFDQYYIIYISRHSANRSIKLEYFFVVSHDAMNYGLDDVTIHSYGNDNVYEHSF